MKQFFLNIIMLLIFGEIVGQADIIKASGIGKIIYRDKKSTQILRNKNLSLDSVTVSVTEYADRIETHSFFIGSKSNLYITFFRRGGKLILATGKEPSPLRNNFFMMFSHYFEDGQIIHIKHRYTWKLGLALKPEEHEAYFGYNQNFTIDFLKSYVSSLYNKL